ncbi:peptidoglycan-binding protein [Neorhizobium galegae]|uniref:peptidoglycan-binding protein n=1 Tax=Neorhizobium galegae TaxID=399 RepID=UPI001F2EDC5E|nr:peptidoglycan-binding protein [Neorhizobium galegae]UIK04990.1 peptidoglycan-binding protein [Neorhizobium galegae]
MSVITAAQIRAAAKSRVNEGNMNSVLVALDKFGLGLGLNRPHRVAHYLAQLMHESGAFRFDQEVWGPTPAQARYDTRTDLGNTPAADGDGYLYRGRAGIQITGKENYQAFRDWCRQKGFNPPDFVAQPDLVNTDPWEGLVPLWYWSTRNLNAYADRNDIETITKKVNGGKNGLVDRIDYYGRISLVLLGYQPTEADIRRYQSERGLDVDGDVGPKTRAALHKDLLALSGASVQMAAFSAAPVTEEKSVVPVAVETQVKRKFNIFGLFGGGGSFGGLGLAAFAGMDWQVVAVLAIVILATLILGLLLQNSIVSAVGKIRAAVEP